MTKTDKAIHNRADEIWFEKLIERDDYSYLKALSTAWKEYDLRRKRGPQRYKLF